jgi:hypothetical protein
MYFHMSRNVSQTYVTAAARNGTETAVIVPDAAVKGE